MAPGTSSCQSAKGCVAGGHPRWTDPWCVAVAPHWCFSYVNANLSSASWIPESCSWFPSKMNSSKQQMGLFRKNSAWKQQAASITRRSVCQPTPGHTLVGSLRKNSSERRPAPRAFPTEAQVCWTRFQHTVCVKCCQCKTRRRNLIFFIHRSGPLDVPVMGGAGCRIQLWDVRAFVERPL